MNSIKLITLIVVFTLAISTMYCETLAEPPANFSDGDAGTATNPYQIATLANLRWLSETKDVWGCDSLTTIPSFGYIYYGDPKFFIQTADIDASDTICWNDGLGFSPIGTHYQRTGSSRNSRAVKLYPFHGSYNGNNFIISSLYIDHLYNYNTLETWQLHGIGLFGYVWNSTITNTHLENANVNMTVIPPSNYEFPSPVGDRGMLISVANLSLILNCSATGGVNNTCGLIGTMYNYTVVEYCSSITYGNIIDGQLVGSCIGNSIVRNSFARGCTEFNNFHSYQGLFGLTTGYTQIENVYIASLNGNSNINWLVYDFTYTSIWNSRFEIDTSNAPNADLELGFPSDPQVTNFVNFCYALYTPEMKDPSSYNGWDFENIWGIDPDINDGYPYLRHDTIAEYILSESDVTIAPMTSQLLGNYPNPFNPSTTIQYSLAEAGKVKISVYNIKGQLVTTLINEVKEAGHHSIIWRGDDSRAKKVSSGIYFYKMDTKTGSDIKKMLLLK